MGGPSRRGNWPPMVHRMARRINRESRLPGRRYIPLDNAYLIAVSKLGEYGYITPKRGVLSKAGQRYEDGK